MTNKLKTSQFKYLLKRIILTLLEELITVNYHKINLPFIFLIFKDSSSNKLLQIKFKKL